MEVQKRSHRGFILIGATEQQIAENQVTAEWALRTTARSIGKLFEESEDPYLRERQSDIDFVAQRLLRLTAG